MTTLRKLFFQGSFLPVLIEASIGSFAMLLVIFSVLRDIPPINVIPTFLFLLQPPVVWAALRLKPHRPERKVFAILFAILREIAFELLLRAVVFGAIWILANTYQVMDLILTGRADSWLNVTFFSIFLLPFVGYRLLFFGIFYWKKLTQKSLLWTLVNSHLVVVFILIAIASLIGRITSSGSIDKFVPSTLLANLVLDLVRSVIPWIAVSLVLVLVVEAIFLPPTILFSYLTSRRFVRRINALAQAMRQARSGDLSARVEPVGEDEVTQLQADFNHMAMQLQQEREKVDQLLKNQRELAAVVSHELRTPITVMRAYVEDHLLQENSTRSTADVRHDLQTVHHEILSLQSLVDDLFTLSRLDAQRMELNCEWIELGQVLDRISTVYQPLAWKEKRIEFSTQLPLILPRVWGDTMRIEQVTGNLIQNAIRHTPEGGAVVLSAVVSTGWLEVSLLDCGEGIDRADLPHVWERFYRGSRAGVTTGRTGIGLSLVKDLVEAMSGSVGVESQVGEGSRFWFRLRAKTE